MPDYRKKRRNKIPFSQPKAKKAKVERKSSREDIEMTPSGINKKTARPKNDMRVVMGRKLEQKRKAKLAFAVAAVVLVLVMLFQIVLPAGIFETVSSTLALIGSGSYPIEPDGNRAVSVISRGSYYYVLTDETVNAYSNSGKRLLSYAHGFENPVIKTSQTRAIVFDQGGDEVLVFSVGDLKHKLQTKHAVITAAISDSGRFAVAVNSDKYTSAVTVYDKSGENVVYEWYSAEDIINNVALAPNGKKMAVSVLNADSGRFNCKLSVLNFKSATPLYTKSYGDALIYTLDSTHGSSFAAVTSNRIDFIKWSNYKTKEYQNEYNTAFFRAGKGGYVVVYNRDRDKTDNRIAVFSKSGKPKYEIEYKGIISDIRVSGGHIYCISDTAVNLVSNKGEILRSASCGFDAVALSITGTNTVAVISDSEIDKIKLE